MTANAKASELRSKLFALVAEFKALHQQVAHTDAGPDADAAACALAKLHDELPDLFIDAARDTNDQSYASVTI